MSEYEVQQLREDVTQIRTTVSGLGDKVHETMIAQARMKVSQDQTTEVVKGMNATLRWFLMAIAGSVIAFVVAWALKGGFVSEAKADAVPMVRYEHL